MRLKNGFACLVIALYLLSTAALYADTDVQSTSLDEQLDKFNKHRALEPVNTKNGLLQFLANFPESGTDEQLTFAYIILGSSYVTISNPDSARIALVQAGKLMTDHFELHIQFDYASTFGRYYNLTNNYDSADYFYDQAVHLAEKINDPLYLATVYGGIGNLADNRGRPKEAFEYFLKSLEYFEEIDDRKSMAVIYNNLAIINNDMDNFKPAYEYYYKAIAINKAIGAYHDLSMNYGNLGVLHKTAGNLQQAIAAYDTSNMIAEEHGFVMDFARNKLNMGNLLIITNDLEAAEKNLLESLQLCEEINLDYGKMLNYSALADLSLKKDALQLAKSYAKKTIEMAERFEDLKLLRKSNDMLSVIYEKKGLFEQALAYRKAYVAANDSIISRSNKNLVLELQARYDNKRKELENSALKAENLLKEQAIKVQKIVTLIISVAFVILALLLFFVFRVTSQLKNANRSLKELNQQIIRQNTLLEETVKTKDKLFSIIGHDLRSPFNSMLGILQLMIDNPYNFESKEHKLLLNQLYSKGNDTYTLVENLLQWAMSQEGQIAFKPALHTLFEIVEDEVSFLSNRADKKQIELTNQVSEDIMVWCDHNMMTTVFRNVINNAIKYTPTKGSINITAKVKSEHVFVTVSDSGIGMTAETIERIQQDNMFHSEKGTDNESGTGLGLKIVKEFLTVNKALFSITSNPGKGTDFVIRLNKKEF